MFTHNPGDCFVLKSFAGTLMKLRQWQNLMAKQVEDRCHPSGAQTRWVVQAHRYILSLLPLYFDRVYTFASPLYGFDTTNLWSQVDTAKKWPTSWDQVITQALWQQEKVGNTAAICLALETSSGARPERGYQLGGTQDSAVEEA
jgi:hypothetical protein